MSYSQSSQSSSDFKPFATTVEGKTGILISFQRMDSISKKLIDYKFILKDKKTYFDLYTNEKKVSFSLDKKYLNANSNANKYKKLYEIAEEQKDLEHNNFNEQKKITNKVKWQWGCGGIVVGVTIIGVLTLVK